MLIKELSFRGLPYKISMREMIPQDPSWFSFEDESIVRDRDWTISPGDVVLDIGSAYGSYALTALASGASFIHTWNPNSDENGILRESLGLNGWDEKAVLHEDGLWSKTGFLRDTDLAFSETEPQTGGFQVRALDSYELGLSRLDWMKLDVEGAEVEVLKGAEGLIRTFKPKVVVENHQFKDPTIESRVAGFLAELGYETVRVTPYHGVSHGLHVPRS